MVFELKYFDGKSSVPRPALGQIVDQDLVITDTQTHDELERWPLEKTQLVSNRSGHSALFKNEDSLARIRLIDTRADFEEIVQRLPNRGRSRMDRKTKWRLAKWTVGSTVSLGVIFFVLLPAMVTILTTYMPRETERRIGQKLSEGIYQQSALVFDAQGICVYPDGLASVAKLKNALNKHAELDYEVDIAVIDSYLVNAFALPGGQMVLLSGFLDEASSPEEIIAVMAHELGHLDHRHPLSATLAALGRSSILSIVLGDVSGGVVTAGVVEALINARYSRDIEEEADDYAIALLNDIGVGTEPLATFFDYIADEYGDLEGVWQSFSTHPELVARAQKARDANMHVDGKIDGFTDRDYENLLGVCDEVEEIEEGGIVKILSDIRDRVEDVNNRVEEFEDPFDPVTPSDGSIEGEDDSEVDAEVEN